MQPPADKERQRCWFAKHLCFIIPGRFRNYFACDLLTPKTRKVIAPKIFVAWEFLKNIHSSARTETGGLHSGSRAWGPFRILVSVSLGRVRKSSSIAVWCTQEIVQNGAQPFGFWPSRTRSWRLYCISGMAGDPRCCEQ